MSLAEMNSHYKRVKCNYSVLLERRKASATLISGLGVALTWVWPFPPTTRKWNGMRRRHANCGSLPSTQLRLIHN